MKIFIDDNFLLSNPTATRLYHQYAKEMPLLDYHCHLNPQDIYEDKHYRNITELWLGEDHYKWRAMRTNGVDEHFITGNAQEKEKFLKWAETIPHCVGNPLFHWTHLELKRYFGIDELLTPETAESFWERCNALLRQEDFSARGLIRRSNVKFLCTTDDPVDDLSSHLSLKRDTLFETKVFPTFRPDQALDIDKDGFLNYIQKLRDASGTSIQHIDDVKTALLQRLEFFHSRGCRLSDHALDYLVFSCFPDFEKLAQSAFLKAWKGDPLSYDEIVAYKTDILLFLGRQYARLGWAMQLHLGAMRDNNRRMMRKLGANTGFDAAGDWPVASSLSCLLGILDETDELPKTILYSLNPCDNVILGTLMGCFQGGIPGKVQLGSAWWFNDHKDGMEKQLKDLSNLGLLSRFIGMLTDSRSFLSYTRHEYFRRILCNLIGQWVVNGEVPDDEDFLGSMIQNICYNNAYHYFSLE